VVRRGFDEIREITDRQLDAASREPTRKPAGLPVMLKQLPEADGGISDVHRFWEQTGNFYISGSGNENLADPYIGLGMMPASTGVFRDMTQIRFDYPEYIPENCTACGNCFTVCPDSAIPGLVNSVADVFNTAIASIETGGQPTLHLRRAVRDVEKRLRTLVEPVGEAAEIDKLLDQAVLSTLAESGLEGGDRARLEEEFGWFMETIGEFRFAVTKPYYLNHEKQAKNSGGLFSVTINPYTCKGCMECVESCNDEALVATPQTAGSIARLRHDWAFWLKLPTTRPEYIRIDDLDECIGALETLLLDKHNFGAMVCGDGACVGCGEKTVLRLFTATVTALMQQRVKRHLEKIDDLIERLEQHIHLRLAESVDLTDTAVISGILESHRDNDLSLSALSGELDAAHATEPVDTEWLRRTTGLLEQLRQLGWLYREGQTQQGRATMGIINATGCSSVWGSTYPYNPYPFPWANHLFQDSPSMAMGVFQGHMAKMADGFRAIRQTELELAGDYNPQQHDEFFTYFDWQKFSDDEWHLCPPVVAIGGDGAMFDIGFQNLSRVLMTEMPVKVLVLDTQVYSNTGGQACTSGFTGQVSDMAAFGKVWKGKSEIRKELGLIGMAHRNAYVMQGSTANITHLLEGYIEGLNSRRPALFSVYSPCMPEHGIGDESAETQSKLAVESRAYPLFRFNPDAGTTFRECCTLDGNPDIDADWPTYKLSYQDAAGTEAHLDLPMTFADFAVTEGRFLKHFRKAPPETWNDNMAPLHEFLEMDADEHEDRYPYIWGVDSKNRLMRVMVSAELVRSSLDRRDYWRQLKSLAGIDQTVDTDAIASQARAEMAQQLSASLLSLLAPGASPPAAAAPGGDATAGAAAATADYEPVWIDTPECETCDECTKINSRIFVYNDDKKATVANPRGGPYRDIVRAAEKCTAGCIHPGTPFNPAEKDLEKLVKRAEKYQ
jgi:pyruvate-ferredoxin/flavodoxin oxidoreductase